MKNQDKANLLLDMQEHPEKYTDEQLNSMLVEDPELAEMLNTLATTKRALVQEEAEAEELNMDELWQDFAAEHEQEFEAPKAKRIALPLRKVAAMLIGVVLTAGMAYAAIQIVKHASEPAPETTPTEAPAPTPATTQSADETPTDTVVTARPVVFDNVELQQILQQIATHYQAEVAFENEDARAYRLYFEWRSDETLAHVVERLNRFESIDLELSNHKITVK